MTENKIDAMESLRHSPHVDAYNPNYRFNIIPRKGFDLYTKWYVLDERKIVFKSVSHGYEAMLEAREWLNDTVKGSHDK